MHWSPCPRRPAPRACWTTGCSPRAPACASASCATAGAPWPACCAPAWAWASCPPAGSPPWACAPSGAPIPKPLSPPCRSEEHTSELQSPCNLVCRLLLEKKKQQRVGTHASNSTPGVSTPLDQYFMDIEVDDACALVYQNERIAVHRLWLRVIWTRHVIY